MVREKINKKVVTDRVACIYRMLAAIKNLPLADPELFFKDPRNEAAAESYLRRTLEALLDIGRHILAKSFAEPTIEYKDIAKKLLQKNVLQNSEGNLLLRMAGYRNRMVHFYHEITPEEIYEICRDHLDEIETVLNSIIQWLNANKEKMDEAI